MATAWRGGRARGELQALTGGERVMADREIDDTVRRVCVLLTGIDRLAVAFSGGVDSSLLLALAVRALSPDRVVAVLGVSPSLPEAERAAAHRIARHVGVAVVEVQTREGGRAGYRRNGPDRCFHCKDELFTRIAEEVLAVHR